MHQNPNGIPYHVHVLARFGRSGYCSYGHTTNASLTGGSLGNDIETIIGPGDSGGAALRQSANGWKLIGISTFTEGYGGRFGDSGGGVLVSPYMDWIFKTTGIPEPGCAGMLALAMTVLVFRRRSRS